MNIFYCDIEGRINCNNKKGFHYVKIFLDDRNYCGIFRQYHSICNIIIGWIF